MNRTSIEWVKNPDGSQGYTWNPITGCLNHDNGLCKGGGFPCYAYKLAQRLKQRYLGNDHIAPLSEGRKWIPMRDISDPFYPRFWRERLFEPVNKTWEWGRERRMVSSQNPKGIFVCDMGDLFGIGIPEEWTRRVLERFQYAPRHRFYLLTKQPQNLIKFSPFPENCWVGVTATNQQMAQNALNFLSQIKASIKFISCEPLLSRIDLADAAGCGYYCDPSQGIEGHHDHAFLTPGIYSGIDWLIIGACTGTYGEMLHLADRLYPNKEQATFIKAMRIKEISKGKYALQPKIEWVREIVEAADKAGIPVFLKDNLKPLLKAGAFRIGEYKWLTELRQEMPE